MIHDDEGSVLMSLMKPMNYYTEATFASTSAEARRLFVVANLCKEFGLTNYILEWDSLQVVNAINQQCFANRFCDPLVVDIKQLLHGMGWKLKHVKRDANRVAHVLAKCAVMLPAEQFDIDVVIPFIFALVMVECQLLV